MMLTIVKGVIRGGSKSARIYRCAGPSTTRCLSTTTNVENGVAAKIGAKHHELKSEYDDVASKFPQHSFDPKNRTVDEDVIRRKRILYRSRQRGWLEVDLMLGKFAEKYVMTLSKEELDQYERILSEETIDIFKIVTGATEPSAELQGGALTKLMKFCNTNEMRELAHYQ